MRNGWSTYLQHIKHNVSILDRIFAILAPHDCLICQSEGSLLCNSCQATLPIATPKELSCAELSLVSSATVYQGVAKDLIWKLKSSGAQEAAQIMAGCMLRLLPSRTNTVIVPVPTASSRVRQRGYDQAKLLARELSKLSNHRYANCLFRQGQAHQVGAGREQRIYQLQYAFSLKNDALIKNSHIVLVDDVVTTGATLEIAAKLLMQAGAATVDAIVFAQAKLRSISTK